VFARLLAAFCLINLAVVPARASQVVVYLRAQTPQSAATVEVMKRELAPLMASAGFRLEWGNADIPAQSLVVLELRGTCGMPAGIVHSEAPDPKDLASTAASGDEVLPYSSINCTGLTRMLAPALAAEPGARREYLYGRAMARLFAHELYHILLNTKDHEREGLAKARFTLSDLMAESLEFDRAALAKLDGGVEVSVTFPPPMPLPERSPVGR
jgi:hypothetical protein